MSFLNKYSTQRAKVFQYSIAGFVLLFSTLLSFYIKEQNFEKEKNQFELTSKQITLLIEDRMDYYTQLLLGGVGLFAASDEVTRKDWQNFAKVQEIDSKFLGIQGIGYSLVLQPSELEKHEKKVQAEGFSEYSVKPKGKRELYTSILYLEPFDARNQRAFGYDMFSETNRNKAMSRAIVSGMPSLSQKVRLVQENQVDEQAGFLIYTPVYKKNMPLETKEQRFQAIEGFVYAPFRAKNFFENIAGEQTDSIGVEIFDANSTQSDALLLKTFQGDAKQFSMQFEEKVMFNNHLWTIRYSALESHLSDINKLTPWFVALSGLFLSTLLFMFINTLISMEHKQQKHLQELQAVSLRKSLALKAGIIGIWEWTYASDTLVWDSNMYKIYDIQEKNNKNNSYTLWSSAIAPQDKEYVEEKISLAAKTNSEFNEKYWILTPSKERKYIHAIGYNELDKNSNAIRMVGINVDITEQKLREVHISNQQDAFLQVTTTGFIHLKERKLLWTNATFEKMLGYETGELQGKSTRALYINDDSFEQCGSLVYKAVDANGTFSGELNMVTKDAKPITILAAISKLKGTQNEAMGVMMDISRQKQLEQNLQEEVEKKTQENFNQFQILQHQSKLASMGEMIGSIAHQWRQPLNEVSIRIQKIKYKYSSDKITQEYIDDFVDKNKKAIDFMSKTIDDFRNFFRVDKEKQNFSIKEAIEEMINIQSAQLKNHNIVLELKGSDFVFKGLKSEFQQVIMNLISNSKDAIISNDIKEPHIEINIEDFQVSFLDNAGGVSQSIMDKLFDPYFTTKEQGKGTGMGLYMSKMIIEENMSGTLELHNKDDGIEATIKFSPQNESSLTS